MRRRRRRQQAGSVKCTAGVQEGFIGGIVVGVDILRMWRVKKLLLRSS